MRDTDKPSPLQLSRRQLLQAMTAMIAGSLLPSTSLAAASKQLTRVIPSSGEAIPAMGLGSSRTFNVGNNIAARNNSTEVIRHFLAAGGTLIDSSPMYGSSQDVIGYALDRLGKNDAVFAADKVWISLANAGPVQMQASQDKWRVKAFDLMQVHNLVSWQAHLETLYRMKADGKIRYVGITTSHGRRHRDLEQAMRTRELDFVQLSYNLLDRDVEQRLLPLAADRGIAVIVNRPFQRGALVDRLERYPLPDWAVDIDCANWPQFLLKFILSHPAVTCAIPATSQVEHVKENMGAGLGRLPDANMRQRMIAHVENL